MKYPYYKCENHIHLDGSFLPEDAWELAVEAGIDPGYDSFEAYRAHAQISADCSSLYDYLACFDAPLRLLQYAPLLEACAYRLGLHLAKEHVLYAEIRFAPQQHIQKAMDQEAALQAVLAGIDRAMKETGIILQVLLCMMVLPQDTHKENEETLRLANAYYGKGVCGLDLAGAEGVRPMSEFAPFFQEAQKLHLPYTIHAGENGYPQHVEEAIALGAKRIGHGVHIIEDSRLLSLCREKQIPLEICYTSNQQCHVFPQQFPHPVRTLFDSGIPITINTDNRSISATTLDEEYEKLQTQFHFTIEELRQCNRNVLQYAFLPNAQKKELLHIFDENLPISSQTMPHQKRQ